ncbi:hypothetical protein AB0D22_35565 [Kitasatospora sp. NPDC048538]|uniref:hypothetical protein n=1 Tax=Kitasatospora sp. NPDC048538 TaxID=3155633 RepID=UPI0033E65354
MSETHPMDAAAAQTGQTAAAALQILLLAAQALREEHQRKQSQQPPAPVPAPQPVQQSPDQHQRYAEMVRATIQPPAVAEAMVTSPQWPQLATELGRLEAAGVDVKQFLTAASPVIARVDADLRALAAQAGPAQGQDKSLGERIGEIVRKAVDAIAEGWAKITGRDKAPTPTVPPRVGAEVLAVMTVREAVADQRVVAELVNSQQWPAIVEQMQAAQAAGHNPAAALAGVPVRIQQAAAAGITLSATEAAQGLLTEQAKAPAANAAAAAASASVSPNQAGAVSTAAGAAPAATATASAPAVANKAAAAATATSTTAKPGATPVPGPAAARTTGQTAPAVNFSHGRR